MVVRKRKKNTRQRAHTTHGWGAKKKHRGSGNRGGFGMAGSGKRAHHKKMSILKYYGQEYYGKHGFKSLKKKQKSINISYIEKNLHKFGKRQGNHFVVNLKEHGYNKLLGTGEAKNKLKITCSSYSKSAKKKIEKAGGEILS